MSQIVTEVRCSLADFQRNRDSGWRFKPQSAVITVVANNVVASSSSGSVGVEVPISPITIGGSGSSSRVATSNRMSTFSFGTDLSKIPTSETNVCLAARNNGKFELAEALKSFAIDLESVPVEDPEFVQGKFVLDSGFSLVKNNSGGFSVNFLVFESGVQTGLINTQAGSVKVDLTLAKIPTFLPG